MLIQQQQQQQTNNNQPYLRGTARGNAEPSSIDLIIPPPPLPCCRGKQEREKKIEYARRQTGEKQSSCSSLQGLFYKNKTSLTINTHPFETATEACNCDEERVVEEQQGAVNK